ncbi:MAG: pyrroline-5-carboxylate reductase [Nanoarchaeota archaeon]|nr:pyrroline-5-carboxylate reductase [Nanoarchaeota archaeon]
MLQKSIGFIGTGRMATAMISCIYNQKIAKSIIASGRNNKNLANIKKQFKIKTTKDNKEAVKSSDIIFICVKPQDIDIVLNEIKNAVNGQLIVSIAAGMKLRHIEGILKNKRVIRVMPNINCLVGEMAAGFSAGRYATKEDITAVSRILNSSGKAFMLEESLLDIVGAIGGSGPAFFAYFIKAFEEAGVKNRLPKEIAFKLAAQTALGTAKLLMDKNLSSEELITMVASKKGITAEGLKVLKRHEAKNIIMKAVNIAVKRSKELGK